MQFAVWVEDDAYNVACVAWRFWLGALSNKGGRRQRNREEIGAGATSREFRGLATYSSARLDKTALPTQATYNDPGLASESEGPPLFPEVSSFPGPWLGRALQACLFCAEKWIFPQNLVLCITLIYCNSLKLPQSLT